LTVICSDPGLRWRRVDKIETFFVDGDILHPKKDEDRGAEPSPAPRALWGHIKLHFGDLISYPVAGNAGLGAATSEYFSWRGSVYIQKRVVGESY